MVKYVPDRTGRFSQRPHYEPKELDRECENIIAGFLKERHGAAKYPVSTDDLTVLIERDTESLDLFADLSSYGPKVEGLTGTGLSSLKPKLLQISSFGAPISSFGKSVVANRCQAGRVVSVVAAHSCFE